MVYPVRCTAAQPSCVVRLLRNLSGDSPEDVIVAIARRLDRGNFPLTQVCKPELISFPSPDSLRRLVCSSCKWGTIKMRHTTLRTSTTRSTGLKEAIRNLSATSLTLRCTTLQLVSPETRSSRRYSEASIVAWTVNLRGERDRLNLGISVSSCHCRGRWVSVA
jgi:hypothetical protein